MLAPESNLVMHAFEAAQKSRWRFLPIHARSTSPHMSTKREKHQHGHITTTLTAKNNNSIDSNNGHDNSHNSSRTH